MACGTSSATPANYEGHLKTLAELQGGGGVKFVPVRHTLEGDLMGGRERVLSAEDGGTPILFGTQEEAREYFARHSNGWSMAALSASIREATSEEIAMAEGKAVSSK